MPDTGSPPRGIDNAEKINPGNLRENFRKETERLRASKLALSWSIENHETSKKCVEHESPGDKSTLQKESRGYLNEAHLYAQESYKNLMESVGFLKKGWENSRLASQFSKDFFGQLDGLLEQCQKLCDPLKKSGIDEDTYRNSEASYKVLKTSYEASKVSYDVSKAFHENSKTSSEAVPKSDNKLKQIFNKFKNFLLNQKKMPSSLPDHKGIPPFDSPESLNTFKEALTSKSKLTSEAEVTQRQRGGYKASLEDPPLSPASFTSWGSTSTLAPIRKVSPKAREDSTQKSGAEIQALNTRYLRTLSPSPFQEKIKQEQNLPHSSAALAASVGAIDANGKSPKNTSLSPEVPQAKKSQRPPRHSTRGSR